MSSPDVVYLCRPGDRNEELRHSLRSLQNVPHGRVHVAGYAPKWLSAGVARIGVEQGPVKFRNTENNVLAACDDPGVSDPFWMFNDDFFVMHPMEELPILNRGPLLEAYIHHSGLYGGTYTQAMEAAYRLLTRMGYKEPLSYDLHVPLLVYKEHMRKAISLRDRIRYHWRTVYGNLAELGGIRIQDVKIRNGDPYKRQEYREWPLVSTSDAVFLYHSVGDYIRNTFHVQGPYEVPSKE